jgi:tetratricopeptide (TPR) repeat protein
MNAITFSPRKPKQGRRDRTASVLYTLAQYFFIFTLGLLPVFFLPTEAAPFTYSKVIVVFGVLLLSIILYSLSVLRSGAINLQLSSPVLLLWGVVIAMSISGLFAAHITDAFIGVYMPPQSVIFVGVIALVVTLCQLLLREKQAVMRLYLTLFASALILAVYHVSRLIFGADTLSFGLTLNDTFTPLGSWNDLGVFFGLIAILTLLVLEQLPLPRLGKIAFLALSALAVLMLAVVQFTGVWVVVGVVALITLMYSLTRHRFDQNYHEASPAATILAGVLSLAALFFFIASGTAGTLVDSVLGIDYLEVRPSVSATFDIGRAVYSENALLGVGPNHFDDAWRTFKDATINQTVFWNTNFSAGNGYLSTVFATTGILGTALWIAFLASFVYIGYRTLIASEIRDNFWYFIASSSFIGSVYLWIVAAIYVPSGTILLLTALCTGVALVSYTNLCTIPVLRFSSLENTRSTIVLVTGVLFVVIGSVAVLYKTAEHYTATYTYNAANIALQKGELERSNELLQRAYQLHRHHSFARQRAQNAIVELGQLRTQNEPTESEQERFQQVLANGIAAAQQAVLGHQQDSRNWAIQAAVYNSVLDTTIPEARTRGLAAVEEAQRLNTHSPELYALEAQLLFRSGDTAAAREAIQQALQKKSDYVPALNLLTELEVRSENLTEARASVRSLIQLEPDDAGRYYQLAVLQLADEVPEQAIASLERAIAIDPDFANARYVLALQYNEQGRTDDAIAQLEYVRTLNPDNEDVANLIERLRNGESITATTTAELIQENSTQTDQSGTVQSNTNPESELLTPVNATENETRPTPEAGTSLDSPRAAPTRNATSSVNSPESENL